MLRALAIRHFTIIEELELEFGPGFSAITGETGAGKSVLVDALGLLLGSRAETGLIAEGQEQADLSARFDLAPQHEARAWLSDQAMDEGDELVVRRVLSRRGSSRAWINGRTATVGQLSELGALLAEIHGQHEHQLLELAEVQRRLVDQQLDPALPEDVTEAFQSWQEARAAQERFEADAGDPSQLELLRFQCDELESLEPGSGEYAELEAEQEKLARADEIRAALASATAALDQDDGPGVRGLLLEAGGALERIRDVDKDLDGIAAMLEEARINVDEALSALERRADIDEGDPERLQTVNQRLERMLELARKHRIRPGELPERTQTLRERLDQLDNQDEQRRSLSEALETALYQWRTRADALSKARQEAAGKLGESVNQRLAELGMDQATLAIRVESDPSAQPARHGQDRLGIEFSANPGQTPRPLGKVASGGELSRVSLALMIAARPQRGPVVRVFDEVDAGIGGETAHVVGEFLRQAADAGQAFCVTHLAQVAARADNQFRVAKKSEGERTRVTIEALDDAARKSEIARMLGDSESRRSLAHAAEMLGNR